MHLKLTSLVDILRNDPFAKTWSMKCLYTANFGNNFPNRKQGNYSEASASILAYPFGHKLPEFCSNKCVAVSKKASNRMFRTAKDLFRNGSSRFFCAPKFAIKALIQPRKVTKRCRVNLMKTSYSMELSASYQTSMTLN